MSVNRFELPNLGFGVGLRSQHFGDILDALAGVPDAPGGPDAIDWFEILSENFMGVGGRPLYMLDQIAERAPIVMHGVSMSIGATDPIDLDYLRQLSALADRVDAVWVSDHLCWTGMAHHNSHDLLPIPYNQETLAHLVDRVRVAQDVLRRPLMFENPSTYVEFTNSDLSEWVFLAALAEEADCGLLLDVNNIYVSCFNHGWDADAYLAAIPWERVVQFHLAGHTHHGTHILDTHSGPVIDEVWALYRQAAQRSGGRATLIEWDADIPPFAELAREAGRARAEAAAALADDAAGGA